MLLLRIVNVVRVQHRECACQHTVVSLFAAMDTPCEISRFEQMTHYSAWGHLTGISS